MDSLFFPPLPVPMIKNECEEIIIDEECSDDSGGEDKTDSWDKEIRKKIAKLVVYQNEKIFNAVVEEYLRLLKRHAVFIQDKQNLLDKITNHIQMFTSFYHEGHENSFQQKYFDVMEEVLTVFSNVQMDIVRQIKKRGCNKSEYVTTIKGIAQKMCCVLSSSLLYNLKHILHVLLKATKHDVEPPSWKDIMNTVYSHFLIQYPLHDYSSESFCRNFLLFERWKEITAVANHKDMERTLYYRCRQTPKSVKADAVISSILMPSSMDSVTDIVTHLIKGKSDAIKSYFDYIEKQKKKCTADEPVSLNDLSFCDLDDDLEYMSRGSDECSKLFYDIVKDYENAKIQGVPSIDINNHGMNEDLDEEGDCIVIDDDDVSECRQRESNLICVISDSDSDCEMVYLSNPTKKKNHTKTKSIKTTPSIPQLWSKTFPEPIGNASSISETNSCSAQSDDHDDDIQILDSESVSSMELSRQSAKEDTSISLNRAQIQKGNSDIREVLRNLVVVKDPELTNTNDEIEIEKSLSSIKEIDLNRVSTPDKSIQGDSNNLTSNLSDSTTIHGKNNVEDDNCHHCSCCAKNKLTSSSSLLISSNQNSGDNREIERNKIVEVSTEIRIEGLESMTNGHTYSYGLITPPSDQPAEGSSSPTCNNVYVEISAADSPRSVVNSDSEEIVIEDDEPFTTEDTSENENVKAKYSGESPVIKDDSSKCVLKEREEVNSNVINKANPTENIVREESGLDNESVGQKTEEVGENIVNEENCATNEKNHSVNVLNERNSTTEKNDVSANDEIENIALDVSEESIIFKRKPIPNNDHNIVDSLEVKDDSSKYALKPEGVNSKIINKENPTENIVDSVSKEKSRLVNEFVEQRTKIVHENIGNEENSAIDEENHSINVLHERNSITEQDDVSTSDKIENITPNISEELIVFKSKGLLNTDETVVDSQETKDDSSEYILREEVNSNVINKKNPIENIVDSVSEETSELANESVEQKVKEVVENIVNVESSATENHSVNVLDERNSIIEQDDVSTSDKIENIAPSISEELIVFKSRPLPNNGQRIVDSIETSVIDNNKQATNAPPNVEETSDGVAETSFSTVGRTNAELTNFPQYVIIDGQHYVVNNEIQCVDNADLKSDQFQIASEEVLTDKNFRNFVANGVYLDENGQECFVENEDNIQTVIIDDVYYSCENGLLTIEEVSHLNSSNASSENNSGNLEKETTENAYNFTNLDHPSSSNSTPNINPQVTKEYHNTSFNDVTSTTPSGTISEDISIEEKHKSTEENVITHPTVKEVYRAADSQKSKSASKIMFTSTESIKLTDFDKFERSVNDNLVHEHNDLWESAFSGPVTKLNSNSGANFPGDGEGMYSFQGTVEKKDSSKRNKSEDICRSYSVSPTENSPEYETIETSDFKKYIQEKENTVNTNKEKKISKDRKQNSLLIHLDKSKIPESVLRKAREQKITQKANEEMQSMQNTAKSILKRKSVSESAIPNKKKATVSPAIPEVSFDPYKSEPEYKLKKNEKEKTESSAVKSHKISKKSSETEKQKAIEVVFGKSKYIKYNKEHFSEESKQKLDEEHFIGLKNLSSYKKQQIAYSCVIRYYGKRQKVYDPQLFEMLPEVSLPFFNKTELLKKWNSQRMEKIDKDRWGKLEKYLKIHHKDRGMKRSCIQERVFYDKTTNSSEVIVYNGGESSSLTSSPGYSGAKNYNSGKHQEHVQQTDKRRGNGVILEKSTPPRKKRGNARKSVSNKKPEHTASVAGSYQCRNTVSNDVTSYAAGGTTSEEKPENRTFRSIGPNSDNRNSFNILNLNHTSDKLKIGTSDTYYRKRDAKPSPIATFAANKDKNQYEYCKRAKIEKTPWNGAYSESVTNLDSFDTNHCSYSTTGDKVREEKKSSCSILHKKIEKVNHKEMEQKYKQAQHLEVSNSKTAPKETVGRESNRKNNRKVRVTFGAVIVNHYDVDSNEIKNNSNEKGEILSKGSSLKTTTDMNDISSDKKNQKMTTSSAIKKIFENKIKNKTHRRKRKSHKEKTFDKGVITHNKSKNEIKKVPLKKQDNEDLEEHLKDPFSLLKSHSTIAGHETLTSNSVNQRQSHKLFKTPAERKELPPLPAASGTNSTKLPSHIINDRSNSNIPANNQSNSINHHINIVPVSDKNHFLQRAEMPVMSVDPLMNQTYAPDFSSKEKDLSPLPVLYNLSPTSKCYQPK